MHDTTINKPIPVVSNPTKIENKAIPSKYLDLLKRIRTEFARRSGLRINATTGALLEVIYSGLNGPLRTNLTWNPNEFFPDNFDDTHISSVSDTRMTQAQAEFIINKLLEICDIEGYAKIPKINTNNTTSITQVNATLPFPDIAGVISQLCEYDTLYGVLNTLGNETYTSPTSSCRTGCTGLCYGSCAVNCSESCGNSCTGGCSGDCTGACGSSCSGDCAINCSTNCSGDCISGCDNVGCTDGCKAECMGSCTSSCTGNCKNGCTNTCGGTCNEECLNTCDGTCNTRCGVGCGSSCYQTCGSGCGSCASNCSTTCGSSCGSATCASSCRNGCSNNCTGSCYYGCTGQQRN